MSERDLHPDLKTAIGEDVVAPILLFEADFPDGIVRIWNGQGNLIADGETWYGLGALLNVEAAEESIDGSAESVTVTVSGFTAEFFDPVMLDDYQGRPARMLFGAVDRTTGAVLGEPYVLFAGTMETDQISDDGQTSSVTITTSNVLADLLKPRTERYTHESQLALYTGDKGLEFVAAMQDVQIKWGQA